MKWCGVSFALVTCLGLAAAVCQNDCNWNGRCNGDKCRCFAGFYGTHCDGDCGCEGHGSCASDNTCQCDDGWKWSPAERKCVWDCQCQNGAACIGPWECGCTQTCKYGACRNAQCVCWEGYKGADCSIYDPNIMMNKEVPVGMNIGGISYYSSEVKFVDIHKQSQSWITERDGQHAWDTHEQNKIQWTVSGYPARLERRIVVNMPHIGAGGFTLTIHKTNPKNPVRNIRVLIHGYEYLHERFPFHPVFLENLKRYSELRFMDFIHTNGHKPEPTNWGDRRLPDYYTQEGNEGGSIEYMIQLANTLGANPWFNMPHAATDDYVKNFARLVKKTLRPDLTVYVEYSNEVWNGIFRQAGYSKEQGMKLHLDSANWKAGMIYYGRRAAEVMDIWSQVYGSEKDRLYPVFAWQTGYKDYFRQAVAALGDKVHKFKALALTGYFNCDHAADKHSHGLQLVMYEGGPGVMQNNIFTGGAEMHAVTDKAIAFNKDSHIEKPIVDIMNTWYKFVSQDPSNKYPGGLFNYFSYTSTQSKYGSWGMLEYTGEDPTTVPKFRAVQSFITSHYKNNVLGPKCSFVKSGALAYGCYQQSLGLFKCGQTDNNGRTWHGYPSLHQSQGEYLVMDGYNPKTSTLYIRVTDTMGANTYHSYSTRAQKFTTLTNFQYYEEVSAPALLPRFTNGIYGGLDAHAQCS